MMSNFEDLAKAYRRQQRDLARAQIDALQKFQDEVNAMFYDEQAKLQQLIADYLDEEPKLPGEGTFTADLTGAVHAMLTEQRPLHRKVIHDRLKEQGIHVGGKDALGNLSAYLSNDSRFKTAGRGEWTLAGVSLLPSDFADALIEYGPITPEKMKTWFLRHYEDPAHSVPYAGSDGGYQWSGQGPHHSIEVLTDQFGDTADEDDILQAANELDRECFDWAIRA